MIRFAYGSGRSLLTFGFATGFSNDTVIVSFVLNWVETVLCFRLDTNLFIYLTYSFGCGYLMLVCILLIESGLLIWLSRVEWY